MKESRVIITIAGILKKFRKKDFLPKIDGWGLPEIIESGACTELERPAVDADMLSWMNNHARNERSTLVRIIIVARMANFDVNQEIGQAALNDRAENDQADLVRGLTAVLKQGAPRRKSSISGTWINHGI